MNGLNEFVNILIKAEESFQLADEARRKDISKFFLNISICLSESADQLDNDRELSDKWGELKHYSGELPTIIDKEIGKEKAKDLSNQLMDISNKTPTKNDISTIKEAAGRFKGFANTISIPLKKDKPNINRRKVLSYGAGGIVGFASSSFLERNVSHPFSKFPSISWKMHTFLGNNVEKTILYNAPQRVCDLVRTMTDGRFDITLERTGNTQEILTKVDSGYIECGYSGIYYTTDEHKALFFGCAIPFGLTPQEQTAWLNYKKADDELTYIQSIYQEKLKLNIIPFPAGATGSQMGGWFNTKINSLDDIKNQTMRIPGLGAEVIKRMGMNIHNEVGQVSIEEAVKKLKDGDYMAVEWTSPHDDLQLDLNKAANFYYYPGWWEPSTTFDVHVNSAALNELPSNYKEIFKLACRETYFSTLTEYDQRNSIARIRLKEKGVEFHRFSNEFIDVAQKETKALLNIYAKKDNVFRDVYQEWSTFKKDIRAWLDLTRI